MPNTTITVEQSQVNSSYLNSNRWIISNNGSWTSDKFDGNAVSNIGLAVNVDLVYQGNVSSRITRNVVSKATITYKATTRIGRETKYYNYVAGPITVTTDVGILPKG